MKKIKLFNDVFKISPRLHSDERGTFKEDYNKKEFFKLNIKDNFVQDNISFSEHKNTIRGLHFQLKPHAQSKLIKVLNGSIFDVFVDLRKESLSYSKFESFTLTKNDGWIYIPEGFAHGFCTLEDKTTVQYKVNNYYYKDSDRGIIWNDPFFNINWPLEGREPIISEKDKKLPTWNKISQDIDF
tara:strand:- start:245 stop:796 length:552 start_codon:yes stop_codon:yes gene_type:complete